MTGVLPSSLGSSGAPPKGGIRVPGRLGDLIKTEKAIAPQAAPAGALNGPGIDRLGLEFAVLVIETGAATGGPTSVDVDVTVEESDDNAAWGAIAGAPHIANLGTSSRGEFNLDLRGRKRYIRVRITISFVGGASPTVQVGGTWILGESGNLPV